VRGLADGVQPETLAWFRLELTQRSRRQRARGRAGDGCVVESCEKRASAERTTRTNITQLTRDDQLVPSGLLGPVVLRSIFAGGAR